jgi:hypothetical protein
MPPVYAPARLMPEKLRFFPLERLDEPVENAMKKPHVPCGIVRLFTSAC